MRACVQDSTDKGREVFVQRVNFCSAGLRGLCPFPGQRQHREMSPVSVSVVEPWNDSTGTVRKQPYCSFLPFHYRLMLLIRGQHNEPICVTVIFNKENRRTWQRNDGKYHISDYWTHFDCFSKFFLSISAKILLKCWMFTVWLGLIVMFLPVFKKQGISAAPLRSIFHL